MSPFPSPMSACFLSNIRCIGAATRGEGSPPNTILATFPNRVDPLSFFKGGGRGLTSSVYYRLKRYG